MLPEIAIETLRHDPWEFKVVLREDEEVVGEYSVGMSDDEYERYGDGAEPDEVIRGTFTFLLSREDPEMIFDQFRLSDVEKNFPEYPEVIREYV